MRFPAVTVCNQNPIKRDHLEKEILVKFNLTLQQLLVEEQDDKKGTLIIQFILDYLRSYEKTYCSCLHQDVSSFQLQLKNLFSPFSPEGRGGAG